MAACELRGDARERQRAVRTAPRLPCPRRSDPPHARVAARERAARHPQPPLAFRTAPPTIAMVSAAGLTAVPRDDAREEPFLALPLGT